MPRYRFRLSIHGRILEPGEWLELAGRDAALDKAHQLARALLELGDTEVPWTEGVLVVENGDDGEPIILPIIDMLAGGEKIVHH